MANRKQPPEALDGGIAVLVRKATGTKKVKGEDLLPPALAKKYREAKRKLRAKPVG